MLIRTLIPAIACLVDPVPAAPLALTSAQRRRGRQRLILADCQELAIALPPGSAMYPGDQLLADDGTRFLVCAAPEAVLRIECADPTTLLRAAYHLGNRHVAVEVGDGYLAIEPDPVLREMLDLIGVQIEAVEAPFQPESGAYGGGHKHGHDATFAEDSRLAQSLFAEHAQRDPARHEHLHESK